MVNTLPISNEVILRLKAELGIKTLAQATIRQIVHLANKLQEQFGINFIRTEMGVPGLPAPSIGVEAEIEALKHGVASVYPPIEGIQALKYELSRFAKLFLNVEINPEGCIPTVGAMQSSMIMFLVANRREAGKDTTLFIDPGFPVQKRQVVVLGMNYESFDIYDFRGKKLKPKLESYLEKGNISTFLYSNPNNPAWICFTEEELKIIGEMANKYGVIVMEDLAYFGMDFRKDFGKPGEPPYQATVAHYTDNYALLFSSSKVFSYAGQRIGSLLLSNKLYHSEFPYLLNIFNASRFGQAILQEAIYTASAGTAHSAQAGLAAMLKAANDGAFDFLRVVKEYGQRAAVMKRLFLENGFHLVYDKDVDEELADGFYFTICYPGMTGETLLGELLRYGISAITLDTTGSSHTEGLRICVSQTSGDRFPDLEERLKLFKMHH